ncbi:MAG: hypothetical protein H6Q39_906, partial [Chloroflexi bacterium]|nr:hypothetical protein [Chloroflexota bacterium]
RTAPRMTVDILGNAIIAVHSEGCKIPGRFDWEGPFIID